MTEAQKTALRAILAELKSMRFIACRRGAYVDMDKVRDTIGVTFKLTHNQKEKDNVKI